MRALPLLLAIMLLAVPVSAGIAPAGSGGGVASDAAVSDEAPSDAAANTSHPAANETEDARIRVLTTPEDGTPRVSIDRHGPDIGPATGLEVSAMTAAMETESLVAHVEAADTNDERQRRLLAAESELRQDELSLHSRQRAAIEAHAAGETTDEQLIAELARVAATAEALEERRERLVTLADETDDFSLSTAEIQLRLSVYTGPVRTYATDALQGEAEADRIYVETTEETLVMTAVIDDAYVREVYRGDRWDRGSTGFGDGGEEAMNMTSEAYGDGVDSGSTSSFGSGSVIRVDAPFTENRGDLRTFVSAGDGDVFVEHQHRPLETFGDSESVSVTQDGFNLTVNRTYPGGPVKVTVTDAEDGDPVSGLAVTLAVGGAESEEVGVTDGDGVVWTLSPNEQYQVTAVEEPRVARISGIDPTPTPHVEDRSDEEADEETE